MNLLTAEKVNKNYSGYQALTDIDMTIEAGKVFGLLGPNGAGKTTFIRIINQITAPDSGTVMFDGHKICADDIYQIGYLPEERGLYPKMKVGEQAIYLAQLKGLDRKTAIRRLKYWFEKFEIDAWWDKKLNELSKGMQQKVQFICTVLHEPKLLIFDEPFSGFDPINANLLKEEILNLRKNGATVIFSTHNMSSVEEVCDDIALFNKSKKIIDGEIHEIKRSFRTHLYNINYTGNKEALIGGIQNHVDIIESVDNHWGNQITIKATEGTLNNDIIQMVTPFVDIISFEEKIPSMNEIFINLIQQNS